jgi:hypothetical protein
MGMRRVDNEVIGAVSVDKKGILPDWALKYAVKSFEK